MVNMPLGRRIPSSDGCPACLNYRLGLVTSSTVFTDLFILVRMIAGVPSSYQLRSLVMCLCSRPQSSCHRLRFLLSSRRRIPIHLFLNVMNLPSTIRPLSCRSHCGRSGLHLCSFYYCAACLEDSESFRPSPKKRFRLSLARPSARTSGLYYPVDVCRNSVAVMSFLRRLKDFTTVHSWHLLSLHLGVMYASPQFLHLG